MRHLRFLHLGTFLVILTLFGGREAAGREAFVEQPRFRHLTIEQGLSQSTVNCFWQDRFGFIWLGTQDGLNRHDGYQFLVWKTDADDALTFSDTYIMCLAEDQDGNLWVGSESSGFGRFDRMTQRFDYLCTGPQESSDQQDVNYGVLALTIDARQLIWIGTSAHGLLCHDPRTGRQRAWQQSASDLPDDQVTALQIDRRGRLWIGTAAGLARLDLNSDPAVASPRRLGPECGLPATKIQALRETIAGEFWVGTGNGLYLWDEQQEAFLRQDGITVGVNAIAVDHEGRLWLGSQDYGVIRFDPRTGDRLDMRPDLTSPTRLQSSKIQSLMVDAAGVVWVGHDLGASLLDTHAKRFYHFKHGVGQPHSLSHNTVWSFCEDRNGLVWITTDGGLNRFDPRNGQCDLLAADPQDPSRPSHDRMTAQFQDSRGQLWLGYAHGALNIYNPTTGRFQHVLCDSTGARGAPSVRIYCFDEAADGTIWMATFDGLQSWSPRTGRYTAHWQQAGGLYDLGGNTCKTLTIDDQGVLWVGTWGRGLLAIDPRTRTRRHYQHEPANSQSLTSDTILSLLADRQGRIWVGTGSGLVCLDPASDRITRLTEKDGLPNNTIYAMSQDNQERIWASTNFGLICLDPETLAFHHFQAKDGLQSNEFNMGAAAFTRSGLMFFGGINGFNVFTPDHIQANPYRPPVVITEFHINNQRVAFGEPNRGRQLLTRPIYQTEELTLDHRDHVVSFTFTALHFAAPEKNRYAYRLEGFDGDWTEAGGRTRATYTNLPPGNYALRVKGSNSDGIWNEEGATLKLKVEPPFWRTAWFMIMAMLLGLSAINGIIRYRTRLMKIRTQELEKRVAKRTADLTRTNHFLQQEISERRRMEEALRVAKEQAEEATRTKSEFLANMSHEIRTPMNGVLGMTSVLLESKLNPEHREHLEVVYASACNLLNIINDILDFSKVEAGKLELESIDFDLRDLAEEVAELLEPRARDKGLNFNLKIDSDVPCVLCGDPMRLRQIMVNLLNNAIKFTERGLIEAHISLLAQSPQQVRLRFRISDTGVGIPADRMDRLFESFSQVDASTTRRFGGTGLGLAICKQLVELMKGEIAVTSAVGEGTTFTYSLDLAPSRSLQAVAPLDGRVLVIMPDAEARQNTVQTLEHLGCEVLAPAYEGDPGLAAVLALGGQPEVLAVLVGGWDEVPAIRQIPRKLQSALGCRAPACLAVFQLGGAIDGEELRAAGFRAWISRPLRSRKLRDLLADLASAGAEPAIQSGAAAVSEASSRPAEPPRATSESAAPRPRAAAAVPTGSPAAKKVHPGAAELAPPCQSAGAVCGMSLLLAEDNPVNQKVAGILLRKLGYQVDVVGNGAEAVAALARRRYALVLMDVQMPVMDGYEAVRRIREGSDGVLEPRVPIIALTAHAMKGDRQRCLDAGMDDYLAKPIDQKALAALLQNYLDAPQPAAV